MPFFTNGMKNIFSKIGAIAILTIFLLPSTLVFAAEGDYQVLAPLPGVADNVGDTTTLEKYVPAIFKLAIGLSTVAAVLMIVIGGFEYMTTDAIQGKSAGKERIKNAVFGLILVIGAWLILFTINPNLININLDIGSVTTTAPPGGGGELAPPTGGGMNSGSVVLAAQTTCPSCTYSAPSSAYTNTTTPLRPEDLAKFSCQSCSPLEGIPTNGNTNVNVDPSIKDNILALNEGLKAQDVSWKLNEAFPPTVHHAASCSYNGTCIDAGLSNTTTDNIKRFIETANNNGLKVQYEVKTENEAKTIRDALKAAGVTGDLNQIVIPVSYINNPHFSVYKK
ncbi:MAG: pilin [Candidatus Paceibacterota bacterium]